VLPLLAMACQFLIDKGRLRAAAYFRTWPLWLTIAGYFLLRYLVLHNGDHFVFYKRQNLYTEHVLYRIYTFLATLPLYAKLILWPSGLHMSHAFDVYVNFSEPAVLGGAALMLATLAWIVKGRGKRGLPLGWGLLWFGFSYAPVSGILVPLNALFLEHWMYLPTAGLFLGAAESIARWAESLPRKTAGRIAAGFAITAALALGIKTHMQNTHWRDPITFYSYIVAQGTDSAAVYNNLGNAYLDNGEVGRAIPAFRKAITLYDHFAQTHHNLALALLNLPDRKVHIPEAIAELKRALAINPNFYQSCELLANIYAYTGDRRDEAFYRVKDEALRRKFHIPPNIYREPVLTP
ncbi:MAG TPA: tetratricopeptide repeat protein, partial [Alphaproteobacteria bacterium]|nr:tetratricopeptide repeat protein [Alphaproteobacteria bacterium]